MSPRLGALEPRLVVPVAAAAAALRFPGLLYPLGSDEAGFTLVAREWAGARQSLRHLLGRPAAHADRPDPLVGPDDADVIALLLRELLAALPVHAGAGDRALRRAPARRPRRGRAARQAPRGLRGGGVDRCHRCGPSSTSAGSLPPPPPAPGWRRGPRPKLGTRWSVRRSRGDRPRQRDALPVPAPVESADAHTDPRLADLRRLLGGTRAPTWVVMWVSPGAWDGTGAVLEPLLKDRYRTHGRTCNGNPVYLVQGAHRAVPDPHCS